MTNGYKRISAVQTAFEILEYLADRAGPESPKEIAKAVKVPYGTAMSHIATLCDGGYLVDEGSGVRIGTKMSGFWLKMKAGAEAKRTTIDEALKVLGQI
jgi:DNA-binding IclR family transcriptional regulator